MTKTIIRKHLSKKTFMFGEQTSTVFHCNIQTAITELDPGDRELKPDQGGETQLYISYNAARHENKMGFNSLTYVSSKFGFCVFLCV